VESFGEVPSGKNKQERSSKRFIYTVELLGRLAIKKPSIEGRENLPQTPCIIATTHLSDIDEQMIAADAGHDRKIGLASFATNQKFIVFKPFITLSGRDNFYDITNAPFKGNFTAPSLRQTDFEKMSQAITQEKANIVISAHNRTYNWELPDKPGLGAVLLAHIANVPIVPSVLDIHSPTIVGSSRDILKTVKNFATFNRPESKIIYGQPIYLSEISQEELKGVFNLYSFEARKKMSQEEINAANATLSVLQAEAEQVMHALALKLPPEKRGKW